MTRGLIGELIAAAGYGAAEPVIVGVDTPARRFGHAGAALGPDTVTYAASISKQITAACAALATRAGRLDVDGPIRAWLPELPAWASRITVRHLLHHTAALPTDTADFPTTGAALDELARASEPSVAPGTEYRYCNAGYILLAVIVERSAGQPLPALARDRIFGPLGMRDTRFWNGPGAAPPGAVVPHGPVPLSLGDGGVWTTARDLLRWNHALNTDALGISPLLETPGRLDDGTVVPYGWGVGLRTHHGQRVCAHGGSVPGLTAKVVRLPDRVQSVAAIALADDIDRMVWLTDRLRDALLSDRLVR